MPQMLSSKTVTARKAHRCRTCNTTAIQPGAQYVRETYVYDSRVYDWVSCEPCRKLTSLVWNWWDSPDEGVGANEYVEWAQAHTDHPEHGEAAQAYLERLRGPKCGDR